MPPRNLLEKKNAVRFYGILANKGKLEKEPTCWIVRPYIPSPFQLFQISAPLPRELLKHIQTHETKW